jgi:membrane peptidoglycan carboxypeptidase
LIAAIALTRGVIFPQQTFPDTGPVRVGGELINNYGDSYSGRELTIVECLARSSNVCLMGVQQRLPPAEWATALSALNLPLPRSFTKIGIGDNWPVPVLRLASAYTAIASGGEMAMPRYIDAVVGEDGVRMTQAPDRRRVFDADACRVVLEGMRECLRNGTGRAAADVADVAWGKTGTTSDALSVIQTSDLTAVLWLGARDTNRDMKITGGALAMKLLADFIKEGRRPHLINPRPPTRTA